MKKRLSWLRSILEPVLIIPFLVGAGSGVASSALVVNTAEWLRANSLGVAVTGIIVAAACVAVAAYALHATTRKHGEADTT